MDNAKIGLVIATLTIGSCITGFGLQAKQCADNKPRVWYHGVGASGPIAEKALTSSTARPGTREMIDAIWDAMTATAPQLVPRLRDHLELEIVSLTATVSSEYVPTGKVILPDGRLEEVNGTLSGCGRSFLGIGPHCDKIIARDFGIGCDDIMAHEVFEHLRPFMLLGDFNPHHSPRWAGETLIAVRRCIERLKTPSP